MILNKTSLCKVSGRHKQSICASSTERSTTVVRLCMPLQVNDSHNSFAHVTHCAMITLTAAQQWASPSALAHHHPPWPLWGSHVRRNVTMLGCTCATHICNSETSKSLSCVTYSPSSAARLKPEDNLGVGAWTSAYLVPDAGAMKRSVGRSDGVLEMALTDCAAAPESRSFHNRELRWQIHLQIGVCPDSTIGRH